MVKEVNKILKSNNETLVSLYYKVYFNLSLNDVVYDDESVIIVGEVHNKVNLLNAIKRLYTQNLKLLALGSVVKIDTDKMGIDLDLSNAMFVITNRMALLDSENEFFEYELVEYPYVTGESGEKLYISNEVVQEVVFEGYTDKLEVEFLNNLRLRALKDNLISRIFKSIESGHFEPEVQL